MIINVLFGVISDCHIRNLNPLKRHSEIITKADRNMTKNLDYKDIEFPVFKSDYCKIEQKNNIFINVFCYANNMVYPAYVSDQKFKDCMDLLLIIDEHKSHYVYIKDFNIFVYNKTKCRPKNTFSISEKVLIEHKEACLEISG